MATVAEFFVKLGADTKDFVTGMDRAEDVLNKKFGDNFIESAHGIGTAFAVAGAAAVAFGAKAVQMAADAEQTKIAFDTLLGSAKKSDAFLRDLYSFAATTPFDIQGVEQSAKKMLALGFASDQIIPMLTNVGNAVAALGGGSAEIDRVTTALGQMQAKGKVQGDEMMQLTEIGINGWQYLAKALNTDVATAMKKVSDGTVDAATGIKAILDGLANDKKFSGMMEKQAATVAGAFSNMQDSVVFAMRAIGQQLSDTLHLQEVFTGIANAITKVTKLIGEEGFGGALKKLIPPDLIPAITGLAGLIGGLLVASLMAAAVALSAFLAPLLPFIAIGAAIGVAVGILIMAWTKWGDAIKSFLSGAWSELTGELTGFITMIQGWGTAVVAAFVGAWNAVTSAFSSFITSIQAWGTNLINTVKGFWNTLTSMTAEDWGYLVGAAVKWIMQLPSEVAAWLSKTWQNFVEWFTKMRDDSSKKAQETVTGIINKIAALPSQITQWLSKTWQNVVQWFTKMNTDSNQKTSDMVNGIISKATTFARNFPQKASEAVSAFIGFFRDLPSKVVGIMNNVISSISGFGSKLYSKAKSMASDFWSGFKKGLGINSPSYVDLAFMQMAVSANQALRDLNRTVPQMQRLVTPLGVTAQAVTPDATSATPTPSSIAQQETSKQAAGGGNIVIQNMQVRSDNDIVDISNRLYRLQQTQLRGRGVGGQIFT